jgi:hypothetical protein
MIRFVKPRKNNKMNFSYRYNNILLLLLFLLADNILAQTPKNDLSRGNYLLLNRPFQIEAMGFPHRFDDETNTTKKIQWDLETYKISNYTSHIVGVWNLDWWPIGAGHLPWSRLLQADVNGNPIPLNNTELSEIDNLVRIQWEDDNLHPAVPKMVAIAKTWFEEYHADPVYDNVILSIDLPPYNYSTEQLNYMLRVLDPDLIMWNRYPWQWSDKLHFRQIEYGWYAMLIYNSGLAKLGNDRTGKKPVPHGAYTQAWRNGKAELMPHSFMYYNNFNSLLFGAKYLSTFLYSSFPLWRSGPWGATGGDPNLKTVTRGLESTLFDPKYPFAPTKEFYIQKEINRQVSNIGKALLKLQSTEQRFIRATNIEAPVQISPFARGVYDWNQGIRPDKKLTNVTVKRTGFANSQDVWIGWFNPLHKSFDGTGTTNEDYFMVVNGCWDTNGISTEQTICLYFDFGVDDSINSLLKISRDTGLIEEVPLTLITGNTYCLDLILDGGEGDLFKYNNGVSFLLLENSK